MFKIESSEQRLTRVLKENAGKFTIDEDGGGPLVGKMKQQSKQNGSGVEAK
ncbi:hypothetical protein V7I42_00070 [Raoultella ornithinolytica]|uniref:hypothetical protein n=1 Tax=Raoultella ornithinolytica TaxID=54291 RepID=UPI002FF0639E